MQEKEKEKDRGHEVLIVALLVAGIFVVIFAIAYIFDPSFFTDIVRGWEYGQRIMGN